MTPRSEREAPPSTHADGVRSRAGRPYLSRRSFLALAGTCAAAAASPSLLSCADKSKNIIVMESPDKQAADTMLTFFGFKYEPLNVTVIEDILHGFMDEHPGVNVSYESLKSRPYFEALDKRLATGNGDDVFMVDHDANLAYSQAGYLADLSLLPTIGTFKGIARDQMFAGGSLTYVPTSISAFGLYCNLDLLAERGVAVPQTYPELLAACAAFADADVAPIVCNNDISLKTFAIARALGPLYRSGTAADAIEGFNERPEELARALAPGFEAVKELVSRGFVDASTALETKKTSDDLEQFAAGKAPFMLTGAWASVRMHELAPSLAYEVHPYPAFDDGHALVVNVDTRVSVNSNSPQRDVAMEFVTYLTSQDAIERFANSQCSFSPLDKAFMPDDQAVRPVAACFEEDEAVIGSDDRLLYPIWDLTRQCVVSLLEGASVQEVEDMVRAAMEGAGA